MASTGDAAMMLTTDTGAVLPVDDRITGLHMIELAERDDFARVGRGALAVVTTAHRENAGDATAFAGRGQQCCAIIEMTTAARARKTACRHAADGWS